MTAFLDDPALMATPQVERSSCADGGFMLRSTQPLERYDRCVGDWVEHWSAETPDATAIAERDGAGGWCRLSWRQVRDRIGALAQSLLDLDLPQGRPVVILSDNSIEHALLMLAAMHVGRPACSVSSAYSRSGKDRERIRSILHVLQPALVYAADGGAFGAAMATCSSDVRRVLGRGADEVPGGMSFTQLLMTQETPLVMERFRAIRPDDHAKYLLTSGSTGIPKVVINTHRMLCANQQMIAQVWRFLDVEKQVLLDWLPWSHTFGGNHNFNMVLRNGGTLFIDDGRPVAGLIESTVRNLRECQPTLHFNVPRGFDMLLPFLESDDDLARHFLSSLRGAFYAGAALPQVNWDRLQALALRIKGEPLWLTTSWGSTETAPCVTTAHFRSDVAECIGVPLPGIDLKFIPNGNKLELRVRGVTVFPGYLNASDPMRPDIDADGFYKIGDAGRLVDESRPERGVLFDGRVAEDFKLTTGTWVSVGTLRTRLVSALSPLVQDAVITGHDRSELGALVFLTPAAQALASAELFERVRSGMRALRADGGGTASYAVRALLVREPPSAEAGEITDKGYINQRAVLQRRASDVTALHTDVDDVRVVLID